MEDVASAWGCFFNEEHGRPYYYNAITGVSQWERPAEIRDNDAPNTEVDGGGTEARTEIDDIAAKDSENPETIHAYEGITIIDDDILPFLYEESFYDFSPECSLMDELIRMGFMSLSEDEITYIISGKTAKNLKKKIDVIDILFLLLSFKSLFRPWIIVCKQWVQMKNGLKYSSIMIWCSSDIF